MITINELSGFIVNLVCLFSINIWFLYIKVKHKPKFNAIELVIFSGMCLQLVIKQVYWILAFVTTDSLDLIRKFMIVDYVSYSILDYALTYGIFILFKFYVTIVSNEQSKRNRAEKIARIGFNYFSVFIVAFDWVTIIYFGIN